MSIAKTVLKAIGNTPLVELRRVVPADHARVLVKLECNNPTGSMKDRMAIAVIECAESDGRLQPGGTVVEYTGGSTGTSLALVCAAKAHKIRIVTSDAFSQEKRDHMRALGADLYEVPSDGGRITKELIEEMIERARQLSDEAGMFYSDQLQNKDAVAGYHPLGEEIWSQTEGQIDAFVHVVGTAHSIAGTSTVLRRHNPDIRIIAVEPEESPVLSGGEQGAHKIEGIGIGFIPPLWKTSIADEIMTVSTQEAKAMARHLASQEALFVGTSSGANVVATIRMAKQLGPGHTVATLLCDSGLKYLTTDLYTSS
ncbi:MAG: PLP-dependent cysteine synthase family protein [Desulfobacterales bacterium]|jgi:cysteine synthase A|nr:PLP-dependent cysteine synthase family protein [Desulfobacterales bacterium]MDH3837009.1 PLP-dependent cysteine synthase family protein [Desulfobacteraceae bacterium]MDH3884651.1 PLP-dependent cysteine synthase family protein [Desulfobacterales bacterium]